MFDHQRIDEIAEEAHAEIRAMVQRAREELDRRYAFARRSLGQRTRHLKHLFPKEKSE